MLQKIWHAWLNILEIKSRMIKRIRKSSNQEYEKNLQYLQDVIESKIKFVKDVNNDINILNTLSKLNIFAISHKVLCRTDLSYQEIKNFVSTFGPCTVVPKEKNIFEVYFGNIEDANICSVSSTQNIKFEKTFFELSKNEICDKLKNFNGTFNNNLPLDYDTIFIGPLDVYVRDFAKIINDISPLFGIQKIGKYFKLLFQDTNITKRFVKIISSIKIESKSNFIIKYVYANCKINYFIPFIKFPFVSFLLNSRIVFLLNSKFTEVEIYSLCDIKVVKIIIKQDITFVECENIDDGVKFYNLFGGMVFKERIVVSGFYPEFNYVIGDL